MNKNKLIDSSGRKLRIKRYFVVNYQTGQIFSGPFFATNERTADKEAWETNQVPIGVGYRLIKG